MMVGEFNFADLFIPDGLENGTPTTQIVFVLFVLLVSIIIMNLLIGLAIRYYLYLHIMFGIIPKFILLSS